MKLHAKLEKLDVLEKECFRLTRTQQTAEVSLCLFLKRQCQEGSKAGAACALTVKDWSSSHTAVSDAMVPAVEKVCSESVSELAF